MNYKLIGWADSDISPYPEHRDITDYVRELIIEDIRKNGYLFGGDRQEEYCPVLNDGTMVTFSWRGWGAVMAEAWNQDTTNPHYYMFAYMNEQIDPEKRKYPKLFVNKDLIVKRSKLSECFDVIVDTATFEEIKEGKKAVNLHLERDVRARLDVGDFLTFNGDDTEKFEIVNIEYYEPQYSDYIAEVKARAQMAEIQKDKDGYERLKRGFYKFWADEYKAHYCDVKVRLKNRKLKVLK
jgi:ASC-1-like (ASCH) protein